MPFDPETTTVREVERRRAHAVDQWIQEDRARAEVEMAKRFGDDWRAHLAPTIEKENP